METKSMGQVYVMGEPQAPEPDRRQALGSPVPQPKSEKKVQINPDPAEEIKEVPPDDDP